MRQYFHPIPKPLLNAVSELKRQIKNRIFFVHLLFDQIKIATQIHGQ